METSHALFGSPLGALGIAWGPRGIRALVLPAANEGETLERLREKLGPSCAAPPPPAIARAIERIRRHLLGESQELSDLALDMEGLPAFHRRVYEAARAVASGQTVTYGELAVRAGSPGAARAVGQAMARNPFAVVVPCHRVLASGGRYGGFSAPGGLLTKVRLLELESEASRSALRPSAGAAVVSPGASSQGRRPVRRVGALPYDAAEAVRSLSEADPRLGRLIGEVGPYRLELERLASPFASLAEAVVHQQLTRKAAATIFARLKAAIGEAQPTPAALLSAPPDRLREAGLSAAKVLALRDLAEKTIDGTVPKLALLRRLPDDAIVERLTAVRGIGRWTVEMLLLFRLGRPDVLPLDDLGIRKGFARTFGLRELPAPKEVARRGERWRPYRSVASWYLWRSLDL